MNNWVPLALEPKTYTWICGRDDGTLLLAVPEQVKIKQRRSDLTSRVLSSREVSPGVEHINSTSHGRFYLEIMLIKNYAIKAVYVEEIKTWFVAQGSVQHYIDIRPFEQIALEINEHLRQLNKQEGFK